MFIFQKTERGELKVSYEKILCLAKRSPNKAYLASLRFAQIPPYGRTSDTLETLAEIVSGGRKYEWE